jgi:hypothetical protein
MTDVGYLLYCENGNNIIKLGTVNVTDKTVYPGSYYPVNLVSYHPERGINTNIDQFIKANNPHLTQGINLKIYDVESSINDVNCANSSATWAKETVGFLPDNIIYYPQQSTVLLTHEVFETQTAIYNYCNAINNLKIPSAILQVE